MTNNVHQFFLLLQYIFAVLGNATSHQDYGAHNYFAILMCIYLATFITVIVVKMIKKGGRV